MNCRILLPPATLKHLRNPPVGDIMAEAYQQLEQESDRYLQDGAIPTNAKSHNYLLVRSRDAQRMFMTLATRYLQTRDEVYAAAAHSILKQVIDWEYWSTDTMEQQRRSPRADFDLSYGENCATLAMGISWLAGYLSKTDRDQLVKASIRRGLTPFLHVCRDPNKRVSWWYGLAESNWNSVCAGGAGMLALVLKDDFTDWCKVIRHSDRSLKPYFDLLDQTRGGWPEGIGYWNYGMRYAFFYLMASEDVLGKPHPYSLRSGIKATLRFPLDFTPHGICSSFGDINRWSPFGFHYAMSARLKQQHLHADLDARLQTMPIDERWQGAWPKAAEYVIFRPRCLAAAARVRNSVRVKYPVMDWGILADRLPQPNFYCSIRGGSTSVSHSHIDLMSFNLCFGDIQIVQDNSTQDGAAEYMDTTFSSRRYDIAELRAECKNTILVNGVGIQHPAATSLEPVRLSGHRGFYLNLTRAMGMLTDTKAAVEYTGRYFLSIHDRALLVIDLVKLATTGRVESRFHTALCPTLRQSAATLRSESRSYSVSFASNVDNVLCGGKFTPTRPLDGNELLRWCTKERSHLQVLHAAYFSARSSSNKLIVSENKKGFEIQFAKQNIKSVQVPLAANMYENR